MDQQLPPPSPAVPPAGPPAAAPPAQGTWGAGAASWQAPVEEAGPAPGVLFASAGSRLLAYIADGILLAVVYTGLWLLGGLLFMGASSASNGSGLLVGGGLVFFLALVLLGLLYFPWFWARGGQTPGMRALRIRVVRDRDGGPVTWGSAFLRLIGYWINGMVLYIGFIWIFVDKRKRGWHDLIAGTVVIQA